jgi:uncharacterized protein
MNRKAKICSRLGKKSKQTLKILQCVASKEIDLLNLYLTEKCNLSCTYCFVCKKEHKSIDFNSAKKALNLLFKLSGNKNQLIVTLFGGEPLVEFDLIKKIVKYGQSLAKKEDKRIQFNLVTNGTLISREIADFIKKNKMNVLLSMDGDALTQNLQRPFLDKKGSFSKALAGLKSLKKSLGKKLAINMVITPQTAENFYKNVLFFKSLGINKIAFNITYEDKWNKKSLDTFEREFNKVVSLWIQEYKKETILWLQPLHHFIQHKIDKKNRVFYWAHPCKDNRIAVSINGDIFPCHRMVAFKNYKLGNINNQFEERKLSKYLEEKNKLFKKYPLWGGCPALNYEKNKDICVPLASFKKFYKIYQKGAERIISKVK